MDTNPYGKAINDIEIAKQRVETIVGVVSKLRDWKTVVIANASVQFDKLPVSQHTTIDAHEWPDAEHLASALSAYHVTKKALDDIWVSMTETQRKGKQPPQNYY